MEVPFLDLKMQYQSIKESVDTAIKKVIDNCSFAGGPFVEDFEDHFAEFCNTKRAVGVGSGTEAIWMALLALDIGPGDEIITVPNTFIATAEAISFCGATPVFVDIDEKTYNMNIFQVERAITEKTKGIIPVHLFGQMVDMEPLMEIAKKYGLFVIEDACQAHGSEYRGKKSGSIGDIGCFSFYPGKNLGAYGDAGALVTNNDDIAEKIKIFRDHGQTEKYKHKIIGWNGRMDGIQSAILSVKLKHLDRWNDARREIAFRYKSMLKNIKEVILPYEDKQAKHVYHIFAIRTKERDQLMKNLRELGIQTGIHYPVPIHLQPAYRNQGKIYSSFPIAEKCAKEFISLPMFPEMNENQIEYVTSQIKREIDKNK